MLDERDLRSGSESSSMREEELGGISKFLEESETGISGVEAEGVWREMVIKEEES